VETWWWVLVWECGGAFEGLTEVIFQATVSLKRRPTANAGNLTITPKRQVVPVTVNGQWGGGCFRGSVGRNLGGCLGDLCRQGAVEI